MSYDDRVAEDARLVILRELAKQIDGRCNEVLLTRVLDTFGIRRSREYVRTQLRAMDELGAIRVDEVGTVMVGSIRKAGRNHVERRGIIEGIARPSDED